MSIMSSFSLYAGKNYIEYSLIGKIKLSSIDNDLLYRGALEDMFDCS